MVEPADTRDVGREVDGEDEAPRVDPRGEALDGREVDRGEARAESLSDYSA